jgi:Flp pilus assembly CpaE family ATPase
MSILKALQKKQFEQTNNKVETTRSAIVVPFERNSRRANTPPELFAEKDLKIGAPTTSAFNGQPDSTIGKALSDLEISTTAGATLNAVAFTPAEKRYHDFVSWNVEAERVEPRLVTITHPHSTYCEEYRNLRTQILHKSQRRTLQSIVVASINPSEGKSVTALNLSWLLAQTDGVRALIIDSDLRMPSLTDYLGIETERGLSDILSDRATLKESIVASNPPVCICFRAAKPAAMSPN